MNHFRVFGSDAHALIPKDERAKFDQRRESVFCWDTGMLPKGINCMILHRER